MSNAWETLASRVGFDGGWWRLRLDDCQTPAGRTIKDYPVLEYPDWVAIVALRLEDNKVILTCEYRHAIGREVLGLPGGTVEREEGGEAGIRAAAIRELLEETGYRAEAVTQIGRFLPNPATHTNRLTSFLATNVIPHHDAELDDEAGTTIGMEFMDLHEVLAQIRTGTLEMDSGHVAALFTAKSYLEDSPPS